MKKSFVIISATLLMFVVACVNSSKKADVNNEALNEIVLGQWFSGVLPCASCPGIETVLMFNSDGTCSEESTYINEDIFPTITQGKWQQNDSVIIVNFENEKKYFKIKNDLSVVMLDSKQNEINGELAQNYILNKIENIQSIEGEYFKGEKGKGYYDQLTVKSLSNNMYSINISSGGGAKGCEFNTENQLDRDRIYIDLSKINPELNSVMVIVFNNNKALIYTTDLDKKYDLMQFCGGGGSLAGDYIKK